MQYNGNLPLLYIICYVGGAIIVHRQNFTAVCYIGEMLLFNDTMTVMIQWCNRCMRKGFLATVNATCLNRYGSHCNNIIMYYESREEQNEIQ